MTTDDYLLADITATCVALDRAATRCIGNSGPRPVLTLDLATYTHVRALIGATTQLQPPAHEMLYHGVTIRRGERPR